MTPEQLQAIPSQLKSIPRWCVWRLNESSAKVPHRCTDGKGARTSHIEDFVSFDDALAFLNANPSFYNGLGFGIFRVDNMGGADFDKCRDKSTDLPERWAQDEIRSLPSYTEKSPSGEGYKVFWYGKLPPGKLTSTPGSRTELYDGSPGRERYFTVTGNHLAGTPTTINEVDPSDTYRRMAAFDLLEAFRRKGWLLGSPNGEKISVHCPWSDQHSKPTETTVLFKNEKRTGGYSFSCAHSHCTEHKTEQVYEYFGFAEPKEVGAVEGAIVVRGGDMTGIVDHAEGLLISRGVAIYQRGGRLVRPVRVDTQKVEDSIHREVGSVVLSAVTDAWLVEQMGQACKWQKIMSRRRVFIDPPRLYAETLRQRSEWRFPVLKGIVTAPTLTKDGRILETPGYDRESGILLDFPKGKFHTTPQNPTKDQAVGALAHLKHPLREFRFIDGAQSVALSAILTALIRTAMYSAPLHAFDAPVAGSGKSLLAETVGLIATGVRPPALSQGKTDEEDEKRLGAILFAGDPILHLDNCERPLSGDFLCTMLTQPSVTTRVLGQSEMRKYPTQATVLASGNNLAYAGDMSRRVVPCRLDPQEERPEHRVCTFNLHDEIITNRLGLVLAGLTLLLAYHRAGFPEAAHIRPKGSFDDWGWVRGALVWCGEPDPEDQCANVLDADPRRDELVNVMDLWGRAFQNQRVKAGDIEKQAESDLSEHKHTAVVDLRDKLMEVCCRGKWSGKSVGWWLRRNKDRVIGGKSFRVESHSTASQNWWIEGGTFEKVYEQAVIPPDAEIETYEGYVGEM